ncbi:putative immunity protein [Cytobacillus oceanisediminis]
MQGELGVSEARKASFAAHAATREAEDKAAIAGQTTNLRKRLE